MGKFLSVVTPLLLFGASAWFIYWYMMSTLKSLRAAWSGAAEALGLTYTPGNFVKEHRLRGMINGHSVTVWSFNKGESNKKQRYTGYEVRHRPVGPPVTLHRQTSLSFLRAVVGKKDHKIGDAFFDKNVVIDTDYPDAIAKFLTHARRGAVLMLFEQWRDAKITHDKISVTTKRYATESEPIVATVNRLVDVASIMESPDKVEAILEHQDRGDLAQATKELSALNESNPNTFVQLLEVEALAADSQPKAAAKVLRDVAEKLPADPQVAEWSRVLESAVVKGSAPAVNAGAAVPAVSLDQQDVIEDVFASDRKRSEVEPHFDAVYRGADVEWVGVAKSVRPYRVDADFGIEPGLKVTLTLGEANTSKYATSKIEAVVNFPADARIDRGDEVHFSGTMTKADRLMRKIYIDPASMR